MTTAPFVSSLNFETLRHLAMQKISALSMNVPMSAMGRERTCAAQPPCLFFRQAIIGNPHLPVGFLDQIVENKRRMLSYWHIAGRTLLVTLTLWALAMVVPDFYRLYQPLGSFGFYANNDGIITDVQWPFREQTDFPRFSSRSACR